MDFGKSPEVGRQTLITARPGRTFSFKDVRGLCEYGLRLPQGPTNKGFDVRESNIKPGGNALFYVLGESHLVVYIKNGKIYYDLYTCRGKDDGEEVFNTLKKGLELEVLKQRDMHVVVDPKQMDYNQELPENNWFSVVLTGVDPKIALNGGAFYDLLRKVYGYDVGYLCHDFNPGITTIYPFSGGYATSHTYLDEYGTLYLGGYRFDKKDIRQDLEKLKAEIPHQKSTVMQPLDALVSARS